MKIELFLESNFYSSQNFSAVSTQLELVKSGLGGGEKTKILAITLHCYKHI